MLLGWNSAYELVKMKLRGASSNRTSKPGSRLCFHVPTTEGENEGQEEMPTTWIKTQKRITALR